MDRCNPSWVSHTAAHVLIDGSGEAKLRHPPLVHSTHTHTPPDQQWEDDCDAVYGNLGEGYRDDHHHHPRPQQVHSLLAQSDFNDHGLICLDLLPARI